MRGSTSVSPTRSSGWSASNLMSLLGEQRSFMTSAPAGLADLFKRDVDVREREEERYVGTYKSEPIHREPVVHAAPREQVRYDEPKRGSSWLWALPLLLLIPFLGYLMTRGNEPRRVAVDRPTIEVPRARSSRIAVDDTSVVDASISTMRGLPAARGSNGVRVIRAASCGMRDTSSEAGCPGRETTAKPHRSSSAG